jgi:hypothetical protein
VRKLIEVEERGRWSLIVYELLLCRT